MLDTEPNLSQLDDINMNCSQHNLPFSGICGDSLCGEARLFCIKCALSNENCIIKNKHELISLSEILHRFFHNKEAGHLNLNRIKLLVEKVSKLNKGDI